MPFVSKHLRYRCVKTSHAFSLVEVLVVTMLLVLLVSILIPVLGKARETAKYTAWLGMSKSMQADPRIALYYNFEAQTGDEISARGEPIVVNKATGDSMGLVSSGESQAGASDPQMRYSLMRESHPNNDNKGQLPTFEINGGRLVNKTSMRFYGVRRSDSQRVVEGSYLEPEWWAGIVNQGEFQVGLWMKLQPMNWAKAISWGSEDVDGGFFSYQTGRLSNNTGAQFSLDSRKMQAEKFGGQAVDVFDDQWHFVVVRLKKPFGTDGDFEDPTIPELRDVEVSVDGAPFRKPSYFSEYLANNDLNFAVDQMLIGAEASTTSDFVAGLIDEVIIWQEPTTYQEIKRMYRGGAPYAHTPAAWYDYTP